MDLPHEPVTPAQRMIRTLTRYSLYAGMGWVVVMMGLTTLDVAGRLLLSTPLPGGVELAEIMLALFGLLGLAYTHQSGSNIRVTLLIKALPMRVAAGVDLLTHSLCLGIVALLAIEGWVMGVEEMCAGTTTDFLKLPLFPIYFLLASTCICMGLEIVLMLVAALKVMRTGRSPGGDG